jgi:serine phosphatase RsbU (regulator of sigma subunit)
MLRHTFHVAAHLEPSPVAALRRLDEALLREETDDRTASVVCGLLRPIPGGAEVVLASAGHPPPYVRRADGRVEDTVRPGTLLGALPGPEPRETTVTLEPGDVLVLYTDGVTEARGAAGQLGEAGLAVALAHAAPSPQAVVEALERAALEQQEGAPSDDIAILAIGVPA